MNCSAISVSLTLTLLVASISACASGNPAHAIRSSADADSSRVWMALLKGFEGDVRYVGSDGPYAYFRLGTVFRSYHKLPTCAVHVPESFPLEADRSYIVRFHVQENNMIRMEGTCANYNGHTLGELDRVR
jgi:hypothetical protein